jgi:hypothetical protein|tara:strand:- start:277 stop:468 length:192 start_codon:yes stop_codon:yes gene_type:complete
MLRHSIKCSQCEKTFLTGESYRCHWEEKHFYPYLKKDGFDDKKALSEKQSVKIYKKQKDELEQ